MLKIWARSWCEFCVACPYSDDHLLSNFLPYWKGSFSTESLIFYLGNFSVQGLLLHMANGLEKLPSFPRVLIFFLMRLLNAVLFGPWLFHL